MKNFISWLFVQDWFRYSLVGGLSSLTLFAVSNILKIAGLPAQACTALGWLATLPVSYVGQRYFTFDPKMRLHPWHLLFYLCAMLLILVSNQLVTYILLMTDLPFVFISLAVVLTVTLVGFSLFRNWVFKPYKEPPVKS